MSISMAGHTARFMSYMLLVVSPHLTGGPNVPPIHAKVNGHYGVLVTR